MAGHQTVFVQRLDILNQGYLAAALLTKGCLRSSPDEQGLSELACLTSDHLLMSTVQPSPETVIDSNQEQRTAREWFSAVSPNGYLSFGCSKTGTLESHSPFVTVASRI